MQKLYAVLIKGRLKLKETGRGMDEGSSFQNLRGIIGKALFSMRDE